MNLNKRLSAIWGGLALLLMAGPAAADYALNMPQGVTDISHEVYELHMLILWICVAIGVVVFGAILWTIVRYRKSKNPNAAQFHHSTTVEIIWTVIPMLILVAMAVPATQTMIKMRDTSESDMTVKVTGYQWKWEYDYLDEGISFFSNLDDQSRIARLRNPEILPEDVENYLLEVDNPLVVPVGKKIRFLLTSNDVIHSWWVPALGWKQDAIPGYINEAWARIDEPGVYRGQCAELCGRDHAFMPVVVHALSEEDYAKWVAARQSEQGVEETVAESIPPSAEDTTPLVARGDADEPVLTEEAPAEAEVEEAPAEPAAEAAAPAEMGLEDLMAQGEQVYAANCASCHMPTGEGMGATFPALKGSAIATGDIAEHIRIVVHGSEKNPAMAAFGGRLSDAEIAAVITYERNAWGNETGDVVQPTDVQAAR